MEAETQYLPQELIIAILLGLPAKSLVRFKVVCKFWRSLISDPDFARSHFELAAPKLVFNIGLGIETKDLDGSLHSNLISKPIYYDFLSTFSPFRIVGSCRGFLLLCCKEKRLYLWNPSIHVHKPIPPSPIWAGLYGFGYDSSKDDYLIVILSGTKGSSPCYSHVQIFSLRANLWKLTQAADSPHLINLPKGEPGLLFNAAIHWITYDYNKSIDVIMAFDLMERELLEIPGPVDVAHKISWQLWVHGEFLSLSCLGSDTIEIWVMEKYKIQSSWTKSIVLSLNGFDWHSPICSTRTGIIVMDDTTHFEGKLVRFSDEGEQLEHCVYPGYLESIVPMYTESIFSFPLPDVCEQS
ncbi:F-box/kelch-repeat protein At3g23880-like [Lotus japonicus]|uniref:F-box/kelch-repeat protein At3g23880-like n=1 Tax=Lotus japonicus TaxID=34305 RepID=UPI002589B518|nr:F-box/kelch-repeat protein At3g23880-like [Lotus japonicus]